MLVKPEFAEKIRTKSLQRVETFLSDHERQVNDSLSLKRTIEEIISTDYHSPTVIELIQTAHDANSASNTDGKISIHLDETEEECGVLYVENSNHLAAARWKTEVCG